MKNVVILLNKLFDEHSEVCYRLYAFMKDCDIPASISRDAFLKMCYKNQIDFYPSIIFTFIELNGIRVGVCPDENSDDYIYKVCMSDKFLYGNDYITRVNAEIKAILSSFEILDEKLKNEELVVKK